MQVVKNNNDIKFEEETEDPRLDKIVDIKNLNFAKNTNTNIDEIDETMSQVCVKDIYIMKTFLACDYLLDNCFSMQVVDNKKGSDFDAEEEEPRLAKTAEEFKLNSPKNKESNTNEVVKSRNLNMETKLSLSKDVEELKSKINSLNSHLIEVCLVVVNSCYSTI